MAHSWDVRQTTSNEEEDRELEGRNSPCGSKSEREQNKKSDGSLSREELEEEEEAN